MLRRLRTVYAYLLSSLHSIIELRQGWYDHTTPASMTYTYVSTVSSSTQLLVITHSTIKSDFSWKLYVHNRQVNRCSVLSDIPSQLDESSVLGLIILVDKLHVCSGHPESKFVNYVDGRKGKLHNKSGGVAAFVDQCTPICLIGETS